MKKKAKPTFKVGKVRYSTKSDRGQQVLKQRAARRIAKKMGL